MAFADRQSPDKSYVDGLLTSASAAAASAVAAATSAHNAAASATAGASQGRGLPMTIPVVLSTATSGTTVGRFKPSAAGKITGLDAMMVKGATTTDKRALFGAVISDTAVSGGAMSVTTSSGAQALGSLISGSSVSGLASYSAGQEITIVANAAVTHAEGEILLQLFTGEQ